MEEERNNEEKREACDTWNKLVCGKRKYCKPSLNYRSHPGGCCRKISGEIGEGASAMAGRVETGQQAERGVGRRNNTTLKENNAGMQCSVLTIFLYLNFLSFSFAIAFTEE